MDIPGFLPIKNDIFFYESDYNPDMLKKPDWNSIDGVPTKYGYVHSLNEFFKKKFECASKPENDPCNSFVPKNKNKDKYYYNQYNFGYLPEMDFFELKYRDKIVAGKFDEIPNID
jgi:hypothetical protein